MVKILSQSGNSLADMYDVAGSIAGIEQLESRELPIMHEMGGTLFSERFSSTIRRATTGALLQSVTWDLLITDLPPAISRILGVAVFANVAARTTHAQVSVRDPVAGRELPIWAWNTAIDAESNIRMQDNGAAVTTFAFLRTVDQLENSPNMLTGSDQPQGVPDIAFRGITAAFGAGTVIVTAIVHVAFAQVGGISSRGLPVPGW